MTGVVAVVPLRDGTSGKTRLARVLDPADRSALVVTLARHVVATLAAADGVTQVLVVTAEPAFARRALDGVAGPLRVVAQPTDRPGLNAAVDVGREAAAVHAPGGTRLLVVHADLPALTVDDVTALLAAAGPRTSLTLAPDRFDTGTNALLLGSSADPFRFRFGPGSHAAHRDQATARGWQPVVVRRPGTQVDLDTPADWHALPAAVRRRLVAGVPALAGLGG